MNSFDSILNGNFSQALGWTLIHSIWQIAIISLILAALMVVLRDKSARLRYNVAIGSLGAVLAISIFTFLSVWTSTPATSQSINFNQLSYSQLFFEANTQSNFVSNWWNLLGSFIQQNLNLILIAWTIGVAILSVRLIGGVSYIFRLRNRHLKPVTEQWQNKLKKLEDRFEIKRKVALFESALVQIPTVVGYLKPYILVPLGTFAALPANQIEAILAHELAHIKRNDYLINILQTIVEIIYFFHPGIWWISNTIRKERELCCDDLAVSSGCDAISLARALSNIEEFFSTQPKTTLAMALNGKGSLLNRIKRLIGHQEQSTTTLNSFSGTAIILIAAIITFTMNSTNVFSSEKKDKKPIEKTLNTEKTPVQAVSLTNISSGKFVNLDSIKINNNVSIDDKDAVVIIKNDKGEVKEIKVNGKAIPKENWNQKELQMAISQRMGTQVAPIPPPPPVGAASPIGAVPPVPPTPPVPGSSALPPIPPVPALPPMSFNFPGFNFNLDMSDYKENMTPAERKAFEKKMKKFEKDMEAWGKEYEKNFGKDWEQKMEKEWEPQLKQWEMSMDEWSKQAAPQLEAMAANMANMNPEVNMNFPAHSFNFDMNNNFSLSLEQALVADGLIKKDESYSFMISGRNKELIINGKKQSPEVFEKYDKLVRKSSGAKGEDYTFSISK
ncbi:hypothetical protein C3K47_03455 [Solitalea longa]|uniref:Peptidase M56 domain-containing protein n=1 Tax=Solitalea longa TaxID=2079460 RepID=A0A2S5A8M8_9SPHI|nr:M56 family metallopeptidase [Solitalea longa]POY38463.1 hypothetical protein C3K47_03455 [Solitalea longa]